MLCLLSRATGSSHGRAGAAARISGEGCAERFAHAALPRFHAGRAPALHAPHAPPVRSYSHPGALCSSQCLPVSAGRVCCNCLSLRCAGEAASAQPALNSKVTLRGAPQHPVAAAASSIGVQCGFRGHQGRIWRVRFRRRRRGMQNLRVSCPLSPLSARASRARTLPGNRAATEVPLGLFIAESGPVRAC